MRYVVRLGDFRGSVEFSFLRVGEDARKEADHGYSKPFERELSRRELDYLTDFLTGYLLGYAEMVAADAQSFYRVVRSELLVYGKYSGKLFEREFETEEPFADFVGTMKAELGDIERRRERELVQRLLDCIDRAECDNS
jgi:hypothetical protein